MPHLYIFAGLPATGKTTLSQKLARHRKACHLRIDTIEQALRELCGLNVEGEGYRLAYRIATDNLRLGGDVVADSCNPWELTRREWERVALGASAEYTNIEVVCSDSDEHRHRIETRKTTVPGLKLPNWREVLMRDYHVWSKHRIVVDTSGRSEADSFAELLVALSSPHASSRQVSAPSNQHAAQG